MSVNTVIVPRVGAGPFGFGMTRDEAWSKTRGVITSFFAQTWSTERTDDFREYAISSDYEAGSIVRLVAFTSYPPYHKRCRLSLFDQELGPESGWDDIVALLELMELPLVEEDERIDVPDLGLSFGFVERGENDALKLEWISVEASGREKPFTAKPPSSPSSSST